jgi:enterochelin esterase-like enzyme
MFTNLFHRSLTLSLFFLCCAVPAAPQKPYHPVTKVELLTLHSKIFANTRTLRIWLPPGYHNSWQSLRKYPVFYFTDGIATFHGRQLARIADQLTRYKRIPPAIFVGIDNGGSTQESKNPGSDRASEYLPYPDDTLQPPVPSPQGKLFPDFLEQEVRPLVDSHYRTTNEAGLAGSSYGAAIALFTAMERPGRYQWLLLESPSLYIADDILLRRAGSFRNWPPRVYVGAGTNEGEGDAKREMVDDVTRLVKSLQTRTSTCLVIAPGAAHNEDAWRARLPAALEFLLGNGSCPTSNAPPAPPNPARANFSPFTLSPSTNRLLP